MFNKLSEMPIVGLIVIIAILCLFALSVVVLLITYAKYRRIAGMVKGSLDKDNAFLRFVVNDFADAYKKYGQEVNTPAIISNGINTKLPSLLLCERFLNNAVSLFVTLGLFGTFLGLSLSVSSLTELISYSNTSEWLSVLDSVGEGLMSSLSGMGVAFYTSLVGVACSIVLTVLRSILSPQAEREKMEARIELWLDHSVAPTLPTDTAKDEAELVTRMIKAMETSASNIDKALKASAADIDRALKGSAADIDGALKEATNDMKRTLLVSRDLLKEFNATVESFNSGVHDFSEFNYNLRGTVERMDVAMRDVVVGMKEVARTAERGDRA